jgi:hypothetical protein
VLITAGHYYELIMPLLHFNSCLLGTVILASVPAKFVEVAVSVWFGAIHTCSDYQMTHQSGGRF